MNKYDRCVQLAMDYFCSHQQEDGSFAMPRQDLVAYYKPALALTIAGRYLAASRALNWVENHFLTADGDFVTEPERKSHVPHFHNHFYHYIHGWLIQSFVLNGRTDLVRRAVAYLLPRQHASGGFYSQQVSDPSRPGNLLDVGSTCSCGFGLLYAGRSSEASRAGDFLIDALEKQSREEIFYLRFTTGGEAVRDFSESSDDRMFYRLKKGDSFEMWALGYACSFLTKLYQAVEEERFLRAAGDFLEWTDVYLPESLNTIPSVKIGWGAAAYYTATLDPRAREKARTVLEYLVETQLTDGSWYFSDWYLRPADQPFEITADLSGEMALRVCDIRRELERGDARDTGAK